MLNVISFLERIGQDPHLRYAPPNALDRVLQSAEFDPAIRAAIHQQDRAHLQELVGAKANICCVVHAPDDDDDDSEEDDDNDDLGNDAAANVMRSDPLAA